MKSYTYKIGPVEATAETKTEARRLCEEQAAKLLRAASKQKVVLVKFGDEVAVVASCADGGVSTSRPVEVVDGVHSVEFTGWSGSKPIEAANGILASMADTRDYANDGEVPECIADPATRRELLRRSVWQRAYNEFSDMGADDPHRLACDFVEIRHACESWGRCFADVLRESWGDVLRTRR